MDQQQAEKVRAGKGFIAALDQSGGSTPKALQLYGVGEDAYANDAEMFDRIHEMRSRITTSGSFGGDRVLGAILFEDTMDRQIEGRDTPDYLWQVKGVVPFLKVDKGLADEVDGAQVMKPMPGLDELLARAAAKGVFGTKMRSVIKLANPAGVDAVVDQQFEVGRQILAAGLVPIIEPEVDIHSPEKAAAEVLLRAAILRQLATLGPDQQVMLKLTLPDEDGFYADLVAHPNVLRVVALSGGYSRDDANDRLARNEGVIASFPRALTEGLSAQQTDEEFDAALDASIKGIYEASITWFAVAEVREPPAGPVRSRSATSVATARRTVTGGWANVSDTVERASAAHSERLDRVIIRFAGDSGDGMQLTGDRFTSASALFGNDLATLPDFPAEIRAPAGTLAGVSAFQVHISDHEITTPGDAPNVLVAMNPAALRNELERLESGGTVIVNEDAFEPRNLTKAGYAENPLTDGTLEGYSVYEVPMSSLTLRAVEPLGVKPRDAERSKNFFALGLVSWMYTRPVDETLRWIEAKFSNKPQVRDANLAAFKAGHAFGETAELFDHPYEIDPAALPPGTYTNINGNTALAWGLIAASQLSALPLFLGSYPITPASDILHELSKHKSFGVRTLQAEDEIAGIGAAIGAAYGGHLAVTTTSGPGMALKAEAMGLAVSLELPLLIIDVQRGGPSTGLPTKTEAADLLMAYYGRHGESPLPIVAAHGPSDCFFAAIEAARIALKYRTPVILLSDGYLANGTEPWRLPDVADLPDISTTFATAPNHTLPSGEEVFWPYLRDPDTLARAWALPGTPDLMHRIGGIEKEDGSGNVSYDSDNHERMVHLRAAKVAGIADDIPDIEVEGPDDAELLVLGWGSTWGAIDGAVNRVCAAGRKVAKAHLTHLNPFPRNLGDVLRRHPNVLVPEMNLGQLSRLVRAEFLVDARSVTKVRGVPFTAGELESAILDTLGGLR